MNQKNKIFIPYKDAKKLIKEGDIWLFSSKAWYSWVIKKLTQSQYSHVALASWHNGDQSLLELIEFHGWRGGGATIDADTYFPSESGNIDVYRPSNHYDDCWYDEESRTVKNKVIHLNNKAVTKTMRILTGMPYGWRRLWWFLKRYLVGLRLIYNMEDLTSDEIKDIVYPVCSTAVAYSFNKNSFDLIKNRNDSWTKPGDIAESTLLHYLFTMV